jgi:uncharacterized DUF497 family protein
VQYDFEWDLKNSGSNRRSHGVTFEEAATVFQDPRIDYPIRQQPQL